jgi:RNA polymerase sigma-70 factor (ECF subfamily)
VYCLVPRELAPELHEVLRRHFRGVPSVRVIVEQRDRERRGPADRRRSRESDAEIERRLVRNLDGRRLAQRRASQVEVPALGLPRRVRAFADHLVFVERLEPTTLEQEDLDTARLVMSIQAGERDRFADLYLRYFDRIYGYLRVVLRSPGDAEDATQQVFERALAALPRYCPRPNPPFRAWLFTIARNCALSQLRKSDRLDLVEPAQLGRALEGPDAHDQPEALDVISDPELLMFVERLPLAHRQVLVLRYHLDLTHAEIAEILGRKPHEVRMMLSRAQGVLRERLTAVGRGPRSRDRALVVRRPGHQFLLRRRRFALMR